MCTTLQGLSLDLSRVRPSRHPLDTPNHPRDNDQSRTDSSRRLRCRGEILQRSSKLDIRFEASSLEFERAGSTSTAGWAVRIHGGGQGRPSTVLLARDGLGRQKKRLYF